MDSTGLLSPVPTEAATSPTTSTPHNPFNFQTQVISTSPIAKTNVGQRRGHKYKHSSVSAQHHIFQEPPPRAPPVLPASLPVPTAREAWRSMHADQRRRLYWCLCHVAVAVYVFFRSEGSLAVTALSHLVFFDAGSAAVCVAVEVLGNFAVWRRSTIRHPFGLERAEVLAGFAMSVLLLFGGFDLVSHGLKHILEHEQQHHHHDDPSSSSINWPALSAVVSTAVSAYGLKNHTRIARLMRVPYLSSLPSILSNPFHFLTLSFSLVLLVLLPVTRSFAHHVWLDRLICAAAAVAMFLFGARLAVAQASMLLMSSSSVTTTSRDRKDENTLASVVRDIQSDPSSLVTRIVDAQFWQVHYGLGMANLRIRTARGADESALAKLRARIAALVQKRLGEGYGHGGSLRWEVTVQMGVDDVVM